MKLSCNVAFPTMLHSVAWLSFFCFRPKSKHWKLKIGINFQFLFFGQNIKNRWQKYPRGRGEGSICTVIFSPSALSPWPGPFPRLRGLRREKEVRVKLSPRSFTTVKYNKVSIVCRSTVAHPLSLLNWSVETLNTKDLKLGCCNWCTLSLDASERISEKLLVVHSKGRRWIFEACRCLMRWLKIAMMS